MASLVRSVPPLSLSIPKLSVVAAALLLTGNCSAEPGSIFNNLASLCSPYSQKQASCGYFPVFGQKGDFAVPLADYAAAQFTPSKGGAATGVRVTVVQDEPGPGPGTTGSFTAAIFSDAGGSPGSRISQQVSGLEAPYCCNSATVTAQFSEPISLDAGVPYWLVLKPGASNAYIAWVVGGDAPVPVAQSLSSGAQCGWCAYAPSALQFAVDSGTQAAPSLAVLDPYLLTIPANQQLSASALIAAAAGGNAKAEGIMADGTSAAIAVFTTSSSKNVTFSATNGAKVAKYTPGFLTSVAGAGAASVVVTPTKSGSTYYALALVTSGVAPDAEHAADTIVSAESAGSTKATTISLLTLPTPVVLIHGLWGDILSLASTEGYLKASAAFTNYRNLVTPVCYSVYLAFDATTDTLPGHGSGCEVTSEQALSQYLTSTLYPELDKNHWVGGRVDAVAHSMGGLVARHFAAPTNTTYKSVRNRMLGAFRNVITLDTPETGSALAAYLDETAYKRTFQGGFLSTQYFLWEGFCGSTSSSVTVESCFGANGLPLSYPGKALNTGAVWSLIPGGSSIAHAPSPDVFNTSSGKWYAIASDFKDGDKPASLLRDTLNAVISATYSSGAPTTTSILGTPDNDVVVTVTSQTSAAVAKQSAEFKDLEHTPAPSAAKALFGSDSNASVVASAAVNAQVAYWLGLQTSTNPAVERLEEVAAGAPSGGPAVIPRFIATGRLAVLAPQQPLGLGQPALVPLKLSGPRIAAINVVEFDPVTHREFRNQRVPSGSTGGATWSLKQDAGQTAVEVIPLESGRVGFRFQAVFVDGGFAQQEIQLQVALAQRNLRRFDLNKGFHSMALVLEDRDQDREAFLSPVVEYDTLEWPIYLDNSQQLNLTVDQPEDDPVVQVDANGLVHALRPGSALITGDFDGLKDTVEVDVYTKDNAPEGYRRSQD